MAKEAVSIKSNGLRNELKEIRKSIDKLTNAIIAQTHKPDERNLYFSCDPNDDGGMWRTNTTCECECCSDENDEHREV